MCTVGPLLTTFKESGLLQNIWVCVVFGYPWTVCVGFGAFVLCLFIVLRKEQIKIEREDVTDSARVWFSIIALTSTILIWVTLLAVWGGSMIEDQLLSALYSGASSLYAATPGGSSYLLNSLDDMVSIVLLSSLALILVVISPYTRRIVAKVTKNQIITSTWKLIVIERPDQVVKWQKQNSEPQTWELESDVTFKGRYLVIEGKGPVFREESSNYNQIKNGGDCAWTLEFDGHECFLAQGNEEQGNTGQPNSFNIITLNPASNNKRARIRPNDRIKLGGTLFQFIDVKRGEV
jgi:hypothetical protein